MRGKRGRIALVVGLLAVLAVAGVVFAQTGGNTSVQQQQEAAPDSSEVGSDDFDSVTPVIENAVAMLNESGVARAYFGSLAIYGSTKCNAAFSADFPDLVLVSAISSGGGWRQFTVDPVKGVEELASRGGDDYSAAGFDESFWTTGYACTIGSDGSVSLIS